MDFFKLVFQRRLPLETPVGAFPSAARTLELREVCLILFFSIQQLWPHSVIPLLLVFFLFKGAVSHSFLQPAPIRRLFFLIWRSQCGFTWALTSLLGSPTLNIPSWVCLASKPCRTQGAGSAREEPWAGAQEAIPYQLCDIEQNYFASLGLSVFPSVKWVGYLRIKWGEVMAIRAAL